jgi:hypothetical protein
LLVVNKALYNKTFKLQLYNACNKANIVAPAKGSKDATITLSNAIEEAVDKGSFKDNFNNNYNSID